MSEDDEDWFERALRENEAESEEGGESEGEEESEAERESEAQGPEPGEPSFPTETGGEPGVPGGEGDESPFDQDFASAFESAPSPEGEGASGLAPGGGGAFGGGEGGPPGESPESFDEDESFESAIARIDLGIEGLDDMILGGVPKRSLISIIGSAGTGKTTFGLQFLNRALAEGDRGVYLTLEESAERIFDTAEEKGWPFREYADEGRLAVVHLDPIEMANSLASIRNDLPELIEEFGADRLVLDSVSLLEMMYDHPSERRSEVYQFTRSLKEAGVTTLVTSEASSDDPFSSRYGIIEYLADAVFVLRYVRPSNFQETRLAVEIQKIRDANHSRQTKPYEITDDGISVYQQANIF
ncbi:MAG: KaiC domain-containing protein [Haloplanus sp.]